VEQLRAVTPASAQVRTGAAQAAKDEKDVAGFVKYIRYGLVGFGMVALFVGGFVIFNTLAITVSQRTRELATLRTLGASRLRIVRDVLLPGAMPSIATGARLSIGYAWRAVIAGEMLAGRRGIGWMIFSAQQVDRTAQVVLGMALIGVLWILLDRYVLRPIESDTIQRWGLVQR